MLSPARVYSFIILLLGALVAPSGPASAQDWPTFRGDAQRTAFYPQFPAGRLQLAWRKELWRELTGPRAEVIVAQGRAYLGTYAGVLYAWDVADGTERWRVQTAGPIGHSVAFAGDTIFCGSMDGTLRALASETGEQRWRFQAGSGIWVAPLVAHGLVFFGARDGKFHALDERTGEPRWVVETGGPILQSAALDEVGERVLVTSEDMHLYCLDRATGKVLWKSRKLAGLSARDYAPVVAHDLVVVTTNPTKDFHAILGEHEQMLVKRSGFTGSDKRYIPGTEADVVAEQDAIVQFLRERPDEQTFYAFRLRDGTEPWIAPILYTGGLHNPHSPPCVNRETGEIFVQLRSAYGTWDGGGEVRPFTCFGRLDPKTGRVPLIGHGYPSKVAGRPPGAKDMPWMTFNYIGDETQTLSCSPGRLFSNHQGFLGALDLRSGLTASLFGKRDTYAGFYGPGTFGWENRGGLAKAREAKQPYGLVNEWHGPAKGVASVAGEHVFYHTGSQVLCYRADE